jgi:hypothetical protein
MKKHPGRPKKPKGESRVPGISVRFTPEERMAIDEAIKRSGLTKSEFARKSLIYVAQNDICIT